MKRRITTILAILTVVALMMSVFVGCSTKEQAVDTPDSKPTKAKAADTKAVEEPEAAPPELAVLKGMMFGEKPLHFDDVLEKFYELSKDTLNVNLDIEFNPTADHKQKLLLLASAGEEMDFVFDAPWMHLKTLAKDGAYIELDKYFLNDDYPGLKENFSKTYLDSNRWFGKIYGMPITKTMGSAEGIGIRVDLMKKYGFDEIKTHEELASFFDKILENEPGMIPLSTEGRVGFFRLMRPYFEGSNIFKAGNFYCALSDDHKKVLGAVYTFDNDIYGGDTLEAIKDFPAPYNTLEKWYNRFNKYVEWNKYLENDVLAQKDPKGVFASGKAAALNRGYKAWNEINTLKKNGIETDIYAFPYKEYDRNQTPGKAYTTYQVWNFQCIPVTSKKADRTMAFFDWVYQSEENHHLFELGIEGEHWEKVADNTFKVPESLSEPYSFPWYQLTGTPNMGKFNIEIPKSAMEFEIWQRAEERYVLSPLTGFNMDFEPIRTEKAATDAISSKFKSGIMVGAYENPQAELEKMNKDLVNAGLEKMREETIKQVQAFLDGKN